MACEARQIKSLRCGGVGGNGGVCRPKQGRRRRARCRNEHARNLASGENSAPVGASRTRSRREPRLRLHFGAGGHISYGIPSEVPAPASFPRRRAHSKDGIPSEVPAPARIRRRRAHLVRNSVGNLPSGAVFSPEGALSQLRRTRTSFRRLSLAEGLALAETCNEVSPLRHPGTRPSEPLRAPPRKRLGVSRKVPQLSIELVAQEPPLLRGRKGVGKVALLHKAIERHLKSVAEKVLGI